MTTEIKAPTFPESVQDGVIANWHKQPGEPVSRDELLVEIETDKVVLEVVAPADGVMAEVLKSAGETVLSNEAIGIISEGEAAPAVAAQEAPAAQSGGSEMVELKAPTFPESVQDGSISTWHKAVGEAVSRDELLVDIETDKVVLEVVAPADGVLASISAEAGSTVASNQVIGQISAGASAAAPAVAASEAPAANTDGETIASPAARKLAEEKGVALSSIAGTGKDGRITKEDVVGAAVPAPAPTAATAPAPAAKATAAPAPLPAGERVEKRVPMTRLRKRIAERLLDATSNTAMLTTFNEVNMKPLMDLRKQYKDLFEKTHKGARLGFMGMFTKAAC